MSFIPSCSQTGETENSNINFSFSVMQFNVWQEGTQVPGGFDAIVNEIAAHNPDFVTMSEVRNYNNTLFYKRILQALDEKGVKYYSFSSYDTAILSKYPIKEFSKDNAIHSMHKLVTEIKGQEIAVYSAHLDYTHYAVYLPRGYDGNNFNKLPAPITDLTQIMNMDLSSTRQVAIKAFLEAAKEDIAKKRIIILGGDFNEASHLDWTESTKNLYDHRGIVAPWNSSTTLYKNGFRDSYREVYPDELQYPGFTWPAQNSWALDADERDRIDFVYYYADRRISVDKSAILGPDTSIVKGQKVKETEHDIFLAPQNNWPTDHKAVISTFSVKK